MAGTRSVAEVDAKLVRYEHATICNEPVTDQAGKLVTPEDHETK